MPLKHTYENGHKYKRAKYRVENWSEYNESLRQRGAINIWFTEAAIQAWNPPKTTGKRGRPKEYSDVAIETCLMLRQVYHLPLRQTEGLVRSLIGLLSLSIVAPDYSLLSKRSIGLEMERLVDTMNAGSYMIVDSTGLRVYGRDEWHQEKHKRQGDHTWRKLHLAIDEHHQIVACELTDKSVGDPSALPALLEQVDGFKTFVADGAYDGKPTYRKIFDKQSDADIVVPPPKNAKADDGECEARNAHVTFMAKHGRTAWQRFHNYGIRAYSELGVLRYKRIIGPSLKARELPQQKTEAMVSARLINNSPYALS